MKTFTSFIMLGVLVSGCASHGTWSRLDRGAWETLDERIGRNDKAYYLEKWGEPFIRRNTYTNVGDDMGTVNGEEMLWLWKPDGTVLSDQPGQGWELFIEFSEQGSFRNWRVGSYRTALTIADVIAATRKFQYRLSESLVRELGISLEQHALEERRSPRWFLHPDNREREILVLQNTVWVLSAATFEADTVARNLHDRLATEDEVLQLAKTSQATARANTRHHRAQTY